MSCNHTHRILQVMLSESRHFNVRYRAVNLVSGARCLVCVDIFILDWVPISWILTTFGKSLCWWPRQYIGRTTEAEGNLELKLSLLNRSNAVWSSSGAQSFVLCRPALAIPCCLPGSCFHRDVHPTTCKLFGQPRRETSSFIVSK